MPVLIMSAASNRGPCRSGDSTGTRTVSSIPGMSSSLPTLSSLKVEDSMSIPLDDGNPEVPCATGMRTLTTPRQRGRNILPAHKAVEMPQMLQKFV